MKSRLLAAVLLAACTGGAGEEPDPVSVPVWAMPAVSTSPASDARNQYELVTQIEAARSTPTDQRVTALQDVVDGWQGRRYTWEVALAPSLCGPQVCVVLPFDHARDPNRVIVQGWLPVIEIDDAQRGALLSACAPYQTCVFTLEATLREIVLNAERPTSLSFHDVEFRGVHLGGPEQSWIRRNPNRRLARTSTDAGRDGP